MLTNIGGDGSLSVPGGKTGTGVHGAALLVSRWPEGESVEGGIISRPGCPGR
jgi:hypothetical protein